MQWEEIVLLVTDIVLLGKKNIKFNFKVLMNMKFMMYVKANLQLILLHIYLKQFLNQVEY